MGTYSFLVVRDLFLALALKEAKKNVWRPKKPKNSFFGRQTLNHRLIGVKCVLIHFSCKELIFGVGNQRNQKKFLAPRETKK